MGLVLALPLAVAVFVVRPAGRARVALEDDLRYESDLLGRELALVAAGEHLRSALHHRAKQVDHAGAVAFGGSEPVASTSLARYVTTLAEASGLEVRSAESRGVVDEDSPGRFVEMDVSLVGGWDAVVGFLRRMERGSKYVRISSFFLSEMGTQVEGGHALDLEAQVVGLMSPSFIDDAQTGLASR